MRFVCSPDRLQVVAARRLRNSDHLARGEIRPCSISSVLLSADGHFPNWSLQDLLLQEFRLLPLNSGISGARQSIVEKIVLASTLDGSREFFSRLLCSRLCGWLYDWTSLKRWWKGVKRKCARVLLIDRGNVFWTYITRKGERFIKIFWSNRIGAPPFYCEGHKLRGWRVDLG